MDMINLNIKSKTQEYQKEDSRKPKAKEQKASRMVPRSLKIRMPCKRQNTGRKLPEYLKKGSKRIQIGKN